MHVLFVIALCSLFAGLLFLLLPNWENKKMKIISGIVILLSYVMLIISGGIMKEKNNELQTEVDSLVEDTVNQKAPEISDFEKGYAEIDTVIFVKKGMTDTLTILVWK